MPKRSVSFPLLNVPGNFEPDNTEQLAISLTSSAIHGSTNRLGFMHISTARDMIHNTRQAAKSAYDVIISPEQKAKLEVWRLWFGLSSVGHDDHKDRNFSDREAGK